MISELIRYYPIYKSLKKRTGPASTLLEVGSKGRGMGIIYKHEFVGLDLDFPLRIAKGLRPVSGNVLSLPFSDKSFDIVVCSDVLEHVEPRKRPDAVKEIMRVAKRTILLGFPTGRYARESDEMIYNFYKRKNRSIPSWLADHTAKGPVDSDEIEKTIRACGAKKYRSTNNQCMELGLCIARLEYYFPLKVISAMLAKLFPILTGFIVVKYFDKDHNHTRRIYLVELE